MTARIMALLAACLFALAACTKEMNGPQAQAAQRAEYREFKGEKLDPMSKFEENSIKGPPRVDIQNYTLKITGLVAKPAVYAYKDVLARKSYSKVVTIHCVEGWDVKVLWEGILIKDLLDEAQVKPGANTVIFRSADGYTTSVALDFILGRDILLGYKMNGLTLPVARGFPFEVVAEGKWGYKWARWVTEIRLGDNPGYRGYWESRGYNNNGNLSGPIFEK